MRWAADWTVINSRQRRFKEEALSMVKNGRKRVVIFQKTQIRYLPGQAETAEVIFSEQLH
jgi:hypothetical protein